MNHRFLPTSLLSVGLAMLCSTSPVDAQSVPFKGSGVGQDQRVSLEPADIHIISGSVGEATHVGRFTESLDYFLSYDLVHFAGTAIFTAANGDEVFFTFEGTISGCGVEPFPLPYTATFVIVGGTGRFADATGGGDLAGVDFGQGKFDFTFDGLIDFWDCVTHFPRQVRHALNAAGEAHAAKQFLTGPVLALGLRARGARKAAMHFLPPQVFFQIRGRVLPVTAH